MLSYSKRVSALRSSEIRDLMKLATRPDMISFAGGMPNNDLFPVAQIDQIFDTLPDQLKKIACQYGPTPGHPPLLEALKEHLRSKGMPVDTNEILITTGSIQAINILTQAFVDPGDTIILENPSFIGSISIFKSYMANMVAIDMESDGIDITRLEHELNKPGVNPKMLYLIPNFQNPAGTIYSQEKRDAIFKMMAGKDTILVEDDAYGDLYFNERVKPLTVPMKNHENGEFTICYTGSFSKILGPGLRLGWLLAPPEIYQKCEIIKQTMDSCSPNYTQVLATEFLNRGYLQPYLAFLREEYTERCNMTHKYLVSYMPDYVKWVVPEGGFYFWLHLPEDLDASEILTKSIEKGAVFVTGKTFDPYGVKNNRIRLAFSNMQKSEIEPGIKMIADAIRDLKK